MMKTQKEKEKEKINRPYHLGGKTATRIRLHCPSRHIVLEGHLGHTVIEQDVLSQIELVSHVGLVCTNLRMLRIPLGPRPFLEKLGIKTLENRGHVLYSDKRTNQPANELPVLTRIPKYKGMRVRTGKKLDPL